MFPTGGTSVATECAERAASPHLEQGGACRAIGRGSRPATRRLVSEDSDKQGESLVRLDPCWDSRVWLARNGRARTILTRPCRRTPVGNLHGHGASPRARCRLRDGQTERGGRKPHQRNNCGTGVHNPRHLDHHDRGRGRHPTTRARSTQTTTRWPRGNSPPPLDKNDRHPVFLPASCTLDETARADFSLTYKSPKSYIGTETNRRSIVRSVPHHRTPLSSTVTWSMTWVSVHPGCTRIRRGRRRG